MTEFAVRDGTATIMVPGFAQRRARDLRQQYPNLPAATTPNLLQELTQHLPEFASSAFVRASSTDGPLVQ